MSTMTQNKLDLTKSRFRALQAAAFHRGVRAGMKALAEHQGIPRWRLNLVLRSLEAGHIIIK